jgi:hypothetical protein
MNLFQKTVRRLLLAAVFIAPLPVAAWAQNPLMPHLNLGGDNKKPLTPDEIERQKRIDEAYRAANSKIPDKKAADPWADVRSSPGTTAQNKKKTP